MVNSRILFLHKSSVTPSKSRHPKSHKMCVFQNNFFSQETPSQTISDLAVERSIVMLWGHKEDFTAKIHIYFPSAIAPAISLGRERVHSSSTVTEMTTGTLRGPRVRPEDPQGVRRRGRHSTWPPCGVLPGPRWPTRGGPLSRTGGSLPGALGRTAAACRYRGPPKETTVSGYWEGPFCYTDL